MTLKRVLHQMFNVAPRKFFSKKRWQVALLLNCGKHPWSSEGNNYLHLTETQVAGLFHWYLTNRFRCYILGKETQFLNYLRRRPTSFAYTVYFLSVLNANAEYFKTYRIPNKIQRITLNWSLLSHCEFQWCFLVVNKCTSHSC